MLFDSLLLGIRVCKLRVGCDMTRQFGVMHGNALISREINWLANFISGTDIKIKGNFKLRSVANCSQSRILREGYNYATIRHRRYVNSRQMLKGKAHLGS